MKSETENAGMLTVDGTQLSTSISLPLSLYAISLPLFLYLYLSTSSLDGTHEQGSSALRSRLRTIQTRRAGCVQPLYLSTCISLPPSLYQVGLELVEPVAQPGLA